LAGSFAAASSAAWMPAAGPDAVGTGRRVECHGISSVAALGETAHRRHGGRGRHPEEGTSAHDPHTLS